MYDMVAREGKFPSGSRTCGKVIMKAAEASDKGKEHKRKMRMERKATVRWSRIFGRNQTDEAVRAARTKETNFANTSTCGEEMGNQQPPGFTGWKSPAPASKVS